MGTAMMQRQMFLVPILALVHTTTGCGGAQPSSKRVANAVACVPVRVLDEQDRPLAGVSLEIHAEAWVGPEGAFYAEGGQPINAAGELVHSAADGTACVPDPEPALVGLGKDIADQPHGSLAIPYAGGLGPPQVGRVRRKFLRAEAVSWPVSVYADDPLGVGITPVGPRTVRLGPPRTAFADVISNCLPSTLSAIASAGAASATSAPTIEAWNRVRFRFEGLGPFTYRVTVRSCDGTSDHTLDAAERGVERRLTWATAPHPGHSPAGNAVQLVAHATRGCVVTDVGELGCFESVYRRTDLQPPRLLASWLDLGKLASPGTTAQIAGVGPS